MSVQTLTIVGVGLIGASVGLAAKSRGVAKRVLGVGHRQSTLDRARQLDAIDEGFLQLPPAVANAELVVFCTPVQLIASQVLEAASHCNQGTILTDAGSTKGEIIAALDGRLPAGVHFVGSHPLAGSEKRGPDHADAKLFQNRVTVVTQTPRTNSGALERVSEFWSALGSRVRIMTPAEHDRALAATSHVPHVVASALAGVLPKELLELVASGFRDTTRIAASDPGLWTGILRQNRQAILAALARVETQLERFRAALTTGDEAALSALLEEGKRVRDAMGS